MAPTLPTVAALMQGASLDNLGLVPAKASLRLPSFREAMKRAITSYYGSLKAAAITFGNVDASQLLREWKHGDFLRYDEHADEDAKAYVSRFVDDVMGRHSDPKLRAKQLLRDVRARLDELDACLERLL